MCEALVRMSKKRPNAVEWSVPDVVVLDPSKEMTVGRGNVASVMMNSRALPGMLSRKHALMLYDSVSRRWCLKDLESLNGVYVNGRKISVGKLCGLNPGDTISFGINSLQNVFKYTLQVAEGRTELRRLQSVSNDNNSLSETTNGVVGVLMQPPRKKPRHCNRVPMPSHVSSSSDSNSTASVSSSTTASNTDRETAAGACPDRPVVILDSPTCRKENQSHGSKHSSSLESSNNKCAPSTSSAASAVVDLEKTSLLNDIAQLKTKLAEQEQLLEKKQQLEEEHSKMERAKTGKMMSMMEEEFTCTICQELFVSAFTLQCSHSFCEVCIKEWMTTKKQCPICRTSITSNPVHSRVLNNAIEKLIETQGDEAKAERSALEKSYSEKLKLFDKPVVSSRPPTTATGRGGGGRGRAARRGGRGGRAGVVVPVVIESSSSESSDDEEGSSSSFDSEEDTLDSDDDIVEGMAGAHYGGYGRCYNCGRRGHWAPGCPARWS